MQTMTIKRQLRICRECRRKNSKRSLLSIWRFVRGHLGGIRLLRKRKYPAISHKRKDPKSIRFWGLHFVEMARFEPSSHNKYNFSLRSNSTKCLQARLVCFYIMNNKNMTPTDSISRKQSSLLSHHLHK